MKSDLLLALAMFTLGIASPSFAQDQELLRPVDPQTDQQIRGVTAQYQKAYNERNAAAVAAFFSDSGVWNTPEGQFIGRQEIQQQLESFHFGRWYPTNEVITINEIKVFADYVGVAGSWTNTVQETGGTPISLHGYFNSLMQLIDDAWKIRYNNYSVETP